MYEPESDRAFIEALKQYLDDDISIREIDADINTPELARAVVEALGQALAD